MTGTTQVRRRLRLHPSSVGDARRTVRRALGEAGRSDLNDSAQLLVTEVVTNAILHAGTHVDISLSAADAGLLVLVSDGSPEEPIMSGPRRPSADTGRGLLLLDQLSSAWGVLPHGEGKTVWFQLDARPADEVAASASEPPPAPPTCTVELLDLPVLLHQAWHPHVEALLREYLLANLADGPKDGVLRTHAAAGNAVALLARHAPSPSGETKTEVRVVLEVPVPRVADFAVLADTMASVEVTAQQPDARFSRHELSSLTGWLCDQVQRQSRGLHPTPWDNRPE